MDIIPQRTHLYVLAATCAFATGLASQSAQAADPSIALILGVKGSPFDDALACGALDAAKKVGLHVDLFAPDHFTGDFAGAGRGRGDRAQPNDHDHLACRR